jgi:hypothetical protein
VLTPLATRNVENAVEHRNLLLYLGALIDWVSVPNPPVAWTVDTKTHSGVRREAFVCLRACPVACRFAPGQELSGRGMVRLV